MPEPTADDNKQIVREAIDTLFNKRDYTAAERFWSAEYIQHSAHIPPGRGGLFDLVRSMPPTLRHELDLIMADGDMVMVRGRYSGQGLPPPGSWWTPSAWRAGCSRSTGTSSRMRHPVTPRRAGCPCSATASRRIADGRWSFRPEQGRHKGATDIFG